MSFWPPANYKHAYTRHAAALDLASQIGDKYQQARANEGLGRAWTAAAELCRASTS